VQFDDYADDYDEALGRGLAVSGEGKDFFARGRIAWLATRLRQLAIEIDSVLDFGCGTGSATPFFAELLRPRSIVGIDQSLRSLERARQRYGRPGVEFVPMDAYQPRAALDLAFCNGVFHHVRPSDRAAAADIVRRALRPGGIFAFWENNAWNPATRYVMSRIPFDRDAIPLSPRTAKRFLLECGFDVLRIDFLFIFPRVLRWLRPLEPALSPFPFGTQYQVLCRRPADRG